VANTGLDAALGIGNGVTSFNATAGTITMNIAAAQSIAAFATTTRDFFNLSISGAATKTVTGTTSIQINGTGVGLSIAAGTTFSVATGFSVTANGTNTSTQLDGTLELNNGTTTSTLSTGSGSVLGTGTIRYTNNAATTPNLATNIGATFNSATGGTWEFAGTGIYTMPAGFTTANNVVISGASTKTMGVSATLAGSLTINAGATLDASVTLYTLALTAGTNQSTTLNGTLQLRDASVASTLSNGSGSVTGTGLLIFTPALAVTPIFPNGTFTGGTNFLTTAGGTVQYAAALAYTLPATPIGYNNLTISSGTKTLAVSNTLVGNLNVSAGAILSVPTALTLTLAGGTNQTSTIAGTLEMNAATAASTLSTGAGTVSGAGTIQFSVTAGSTIALPVGDFSGFNTTGQGSWIFQANNGGFASTLNATQTTFGNVTTNRTAGAGTYTVNLGANSIINGTLTVNANTQLDATASNFTITVAGTDRGTVLAGILELRSATSASTLSNGTGTLSSNGVLQFNSTGATPLFPTVNGTSPFFTNGGGTVAYNNAGAGTLTLPAQALYNNLFLNSSTGQNFLGGASLTLTGNLTMATAVGTLAAGTTTITADLRNGVNNYSLTFSGTGNQTVSGGTGASALSTNNLTLNSNTTANLNRSININGDLTVDTGTLIASTAGTLSFTAATGDQSIVLNGRNVSQITNLTIEKGTSGNVNLTGTLRLNGTLDLDGATGTAHANALFAMQNAARLFFGTGAAAVNGSGTNRYIRMGDAGDNLIGKISGGTAAGLQYTFPIGTPTGGSAPFVSGLPAGGAYATPCTLTVTPTILISPITNRIRRTFTTNTSGVTGGTWLFTFNYVNTQPIDVNTAESTTGWTTWRFDGATWNNTSVAVAGSTFNTGAGNTNFNATWTLASTISGSVNVYYSYLGAANPRWTTTNTWTISPTGGGFPGFNIPTLGPGQITGGTGTSTDKVVILGGATVFLDYDATMRTLTSVEVQAGGTLVLTGTTANLTIQTLLGSGKIKLNTGATVVWPTVSDPSQFLAVGGGNIELYSGSSMTVPTTPFQTGSGTAYPGLTLSGSSANTKTIANSMSLNGSLTVDSLCTLQIGQTAIGVTITVAGSVVVPSTNTATNAIITANVNNSASPNTLRVAGDLTHNGTGNVQFTNIVAQQDAIPTTGITITDFNSTTQNQNVVCNGPARFWRIISNKGTNDTYILFIQANAVANFNLFGPSDAGDNAPSANAGSMLVPNGGTLRLGSNIVINNLQRVGNWNVPQAATLWIDGGATVNMAGTGTFPSVTNQALVPYGALRVSTGGRLNVNMSAGLVLREDGVLLIDGGVIRTTSFTLSQAGGVHRGSFTMTGGQFVIEGGDANGGGGGRDAGVFNMGQPTNIFNMSGGEIRINSNIGGNGANPVFNVQCDPGNYNVTGGNVVIRHQNTNAGAGIGNATWTINTRVPVYNLRIVRSASATPFVGGPNVQIANIPANGTMPASVSTNPPLVVLNDFTIQDSTTQVDANPVFSNNGGTVRVGGNFTLTQVGAGSVVYTMGNAFTSRRVEFNGTSRSRFDNRTTLPITIDRLVINKGGNDSTQVELRSTGATIAGGATHVTVSDSLIMQAGTLNYNAFRVNVTGNTLSNNSGRLGQVGTTGNVTLAGAAAQTIVAPATSTGRTTFGNLIVNNGGNTVTLTGGSIDTVRTLSLTSASVFSIGTFGINAVNPIQGNAGGTTATDFSLTRHIQTSGNVSDAGLKLGVTATGTFVFPIGTNANANTRYIPITATLSAITGTGSLGANSSDAQLTTLNGVTATNALTAFWRIRRTGALTAATGTLDIQAANSDDPLVVINDLSDNTGWVAGYVTGSIRQQQGTLNTGTGVINITSHAIPADANYTTADAAARFTGGVRTFFSRRGSATGPGSWTTASRWNNSTLMSLAQLQNPHVDYGGGVTSGFPGAGDIAWIGFDSISVSSYNCHVMFYENTATPVAAAELNFRTQPVPGGVNAWADRPFFQIRGPFNMTANFGKVTGEGVFAVGINPGFTVNLNAIDFGDFNDKPGAIFLYQPMSSNGTAGVNNGTFPLHVAPSFPSTFPSLRTYSGAYQSATLRFNNSITVNRNLLLDGGTRMQMGDGTNNIAVNIGQDMVLSTPSSGWPNFHAARLMFNRSGGGSTVTVARDIIFANNYPTAAATIDSAVVYVDSVAAGNDPTTIHSLSVGRNIVNRGNGAAGLRLYHGAAKARANLIVNGSSNGVVADSSTGTPINNFHRVGQLTVNKGTSSTTFELRKLLRPDADASGSSSTKPYYLQNGKFIINTALTDTLSSGGQDFTIPSTASLILQNNATISIANNIVTTDISGIDLDGGLYIRGNSTLTMTGGSAAASTSSIVYGASGDATIEVTSTGAPALSVDGAIRRSSLASTGVLKYRQTAGTVRIGSKVTSGAAQTSVPGNRALFDMENNVGSSFAMSGGTLAVVRQRNGAAAPDFYLYSQTDTISGGTIQFGDNTTTANQTIRINTNKTLFDFVAATAGVGFRNTTQVQTVPLSIGRDLSIQNLAGFDPNSLGITVGRNLLTAGNATYNSPTNTTHTLTMASATNATQNISLVNTGTYLFSSLTVNNTATSGTVNFTGSTVASMSLGANLSVTAGTLSVTGGSVTTVNVGGNLAVNSTINGSGVGTGYVVTTKSASPSPTYTGGGTIQNLRIGSTQGLIANANLAIPGQLDFSAAGILNIGTNSLSFAATSPNPTSTPGFSASCMIQTAGTNVSSGVTRTFPNGQSFVAAPFTGTGVLFPVGVLGRYTPVRLETGTTSASGSLAVKPVNQTNLSVTNPVNPNVLNFNWVVTPAGGFAVSAMTHTYEFPKVLAPSIAFSGGNSTNYLASYFFVGAASWTPLGGSPLANNDVYDTGVPAGSARVRFTNITNLNASYTAGETDKFQTVTTYTTLNSAVTGNWNTTTGVWSVDGGTTDCGCSPFLASPANGGAGAVVIGADDVITIPTGLPGTATTSIAVNGRLNVGTTTGNNFTSIAGSGIISMSPAGPSLNAPDGLANSTFLGATGGTIELAGTQSYNLPTTGFGTYRNLSLVGTAGTVSLADSVTILGNLSIGGTAGTATFSTSVYAARLEGALTRNNFGAFAASTGVIRFQGTANNTITGDFTGTNSLFNMVIGKSGTGAVNFAGPVEIENRAIFNNGLVNTDATNILRFRDGALKVALGYSDASYVNGPVEKIAGTSITFRFPTGSATRQRELTMITSGSSPVRTWRGQFFVGTPPNSTSLEAATLDGINPIEWFQLSDNGVGGIANVGLQWKDNTGLNPSLTLSQLRIARRNGATWQGFPGSASGFITGTGSITSTPTFTFSTWDFTLGSFGAPLPVTWLYLRGKLEGDRVALNWATASEVNNNRFEVERSTDGANFTKIGTVFGNGTTQDISEYSFADLEYPQTKMLYYRLKQVDDNGEFSYSVTIEVPIEGLRTNGNQWALSPNPFSDVTFLSLLVVGPDIDPLTDVHTLQVTGGDGRLLLNTKGTLANVGSSLRNVMNGQSTGVYYLRVQSGAHTQILKAIKQ